MKTGKTFDRGDKGTFGSVFFRAYADHILFLKKTRNEVRRFSCDTERSGQLAFEPLQLTLIHPAPLRFIIGTGDTPATTTIFEWLKARPGRTIHEISESTGFHRNTVSPAIHYLMKAGKLRVNGAIPKAFYII